MLTHEKNCFYGVTVFFFLFFVFNSYRNRQRHSCGIRWPIYTQGLKNPLFCVPTDELLRAKDDLLSEGGQSLSFLTEQD